MAFRRFRCCKHAQTIRAHCICFIYLLARGYPFQMLHQSAFVLKLCITSRAYYHPIQLSLIKFKLIGIVFLTVFVLRFCHEQGAFVHPQTASVHPQTASVHPDLTVWEESSLKNGHVSTRFVISKNLTRFVTGFNFVTMTTKR